MAGSLDQRVTTAAVGSLRVAVIGSCRISTVRLTDLVSKVRTVAELDVVARMLPGNFHLVASVDGVVRVQSSLTGVRRVYHTRIQGMPIAGDRAEVLARMAHAGADEQALAVRVAGWWTMPSPLDEHSRWPEMRALARHHYLQIDTSGTIGELRWWRATRA